MWAFPHCVMLNKFTSLFLNLHNHAVGIVMLNSLDCCEAPKESIKTSRLQSLALELVNGNYH